MIDNRGFTLVELLATVTIMLLITAIAVPTSMKFIEKGKQKQYDILHDQIISAASKYYINHKNTTCIQVTNLIKDIDEKYLNDDKQIIDPRSNSLLSGNVLVTRNNTKINYTFPNNCTP